MEGAGRPPRPLQQLELYAHPPRPSPLCRGCRSVLYPGHVPTPPDVFLSLFVFFWGGARWFTRRGGDLGPAPPVLRHHVRNRNLWPGVVSGGVGLGRFGCGGGAVGDGRSNTQDGPMLN